MDKAIPEIVVGRLPVYLQALQHLQLAGQQTVSSQELGELIGISAAQIRKDLSQFGEFGKQGKGYSVRYLAEQLQEILKVHQVWDMALVGAGNLGRAIGHYPDFQKHGFQVAMVFDNDPTRLGEKVGGCQVEDIANMVERISTAGVRIAVLTVPAQAAQQVADELVKAGVRAILNYAPITLNVPENVHVQYVDPVIFLQRMTYFIE